jgi:broad specificity phosphatase PhoE
MPTAKLSDIVGIHTPEEPEASHARRVTGSSDLPLNALGHKQAEALAKDNADRFTEISASPKKRAMETAQHVAATNPKATVHVVGELRPWRLGGHEGTASDQARPAVRELMRNPDQIPSGKGEKSTDEGESFNEAKWRAIRLLQERLKNQKTGKRSLDVTSGRNIRIMDAWMRSGMRKDGSMEMRHLEKADESKPGDLFLVDQAHRRLSKVRAADKDGHYVARHAATDWSGEGGSGEGGS